MFGSSRGAVPDSPESPAHESPIDATASRFMELFGLDACWYEPFPFDRQLPRIEPGRIVLPATEPGIEPWSCDLGVELPVRFSGLTLGRFVLVPSSPTVGVAFSPAAREAATLDRRDASASWSPPRCSPKTERVARR